MKDIEKQQVIACARQAAREGKEPNQTCRWSFYTESGRLFLHEYREELKRIESESNSKERA